MKALVGATVGGFTCPNTLVITKARKKSGVFISLFIRKYEIRRQKVYGGKFISFQTFF
jgi:hypothetical protein